MRGTAACGPSVETERIEATEISPLAKIRLSENYSAGGPQARHDGRASEGTLLLTSASDPLVISMGVVGCDVVLYQNGNAVQGPTQTTFPVFAIQVRGNGLGIRVGLDDRAELWVQIGDPSEITTREVQAREFPDSMSA